VDLACFLLIHFDCLKQPFYLPGKIVATKLAMFIFTFQKFTLRTYFVELLLGGTQEWFQISPSKLEKRTCRLLSPCRPYYAPLHSYLPSLCYHKLTRAKYCSCMGRVPVCQPIPRGHQLATPLNFSQAHNSCRKRVKL